MKSRLLANVLLAAVVAGLAAFLLLRPKPAGEPQYPVSRTDPAGVARIVVEKRGAQALVLENRDGSWRLAAPLQGRADAIKVGRIRDLLSATATVRLPAQDLARFELDRPALRLGFGEEQFSVGMSNPLTGQRYLLAGDAVLLVAGHAVSPAELPAEDLLDLRPLAEGEKPVGFRLPGLAISRHEGNWRSEPARAELDQETLNRYAERWRLAYALDARPAPAPASGEALEVELEGGRRLRFLVAEREPALTLWREDEGIAWRFAAGAGAGLLDPLAK